MCGRYTITISLEELLLRFHIDGEFTLYHRPRYNIAPGQLVPAIINDGRHNRIGDLKWGLVPSWAKDESGASRMINARAETIAEKPAYRQPLERKRCLIPADGFYEWKKKEGGTGKQPMRITLRDEAPFALAGLYDIWLAPDGRKVSTCTIVTTSPNELMTDIHDRMPVILRPEHESVWLDRGVRDVRLLQDMLKPYPAEAMQAYPVSAIVGNVNNEGPECARRIDIGTDAMNAKRKA
ncbi:SOS response-associated peptidase [Paenibacillus ginsengarvi]|uniref:Abasic site processing protein n=1 Tax=Paenibacillus ginsengarvi TaxID=400777 RepID=A0A3B0BII6_9BACL|nr:SOS response-associated peptidase [Paenibacillus ginsengarvi]RKN72378.1 SOS response-associated peptidase [Paenibacillus ginsengarvi]